MVIGYPHITLTCTQLLTQMYASLRFIESHAPSAAIPGLPTNPGATQEQPNTTISTTVNPSRADDGATAENSRNGHTSQPPSQPLSSQTHPHPSSEPASDEQRLTTQEPPIPPEQGFDATLNELAVDLTLKMAQIMVLIDGLPGIGQSEAMQRARIRELERELAEVETEREGVFQEWEDLWSLTASLGMVGDFEE
ncbi:hypothetical protein P152DRAFT_60552 [Eremomyces bilateralis CBS 781.70]|uniref:Mediator of RNA polymerase II transcription subunit 21 n=1 Tax=Eremomyces bilateralis CBS 781.70 TaxID=1392243 RepID=A0A6G1G0S3_9PEZI|nr:uncharacterized protein P152DRAFT_60552 [Eremomyces bilateralis CBS 781.70]KAF1811582.1 hypothetical protein P152DRAFT_60552 [Eremomyces bilateralis CBS 781.70]